MRTSTLLASIYAFWASPVMGNDPCDIYSRYQNDPVLYGDDTNQTYFNIGAGLWYQRRGLTFGFSIPYFIKHDYNGTGQDASIQEEMHLYYNLAYELKLADYLNMTPSILVRQIQDRPTTADFWLTGDIYNNFKFLCKLLYFFKLSII